MKHIVWDEVECEWFDQDPEDHTAESIGDDTFKVIISRFGRGMFTLDVTGTDLNKISRFREEWSETWEDGGSLRRVARTLAERIFNS